MAIFFSCSSHSQPQEAVLKIDKTLKNKFSDGPANGTHGGANKIYIDSVLVFSNDSSVNIEDFINADIKDLNGNHFPFDTCKCSFKNDTLLIELTEIASISPDKIKIRAVGKVFSIHFVIDNDTDEIPTVQRSLVINKQVYKNGQQILGEIMFQVKNTKNNKKYSFLGPFTCIVE